MSNYTKSTDFAAKDSLASGNPAKVVRGAEIDTEFNNISTAIATKVDGTGGTLSNVTLSNATISSVSTPITVAQGGTGASTFTSGALLKGAGTGAIAAASASDIVTAIGNTFVNKATFATSSQSAVNTIGGGTQTWMTQSWSTGTDIQNPTNSPIMVSVVLTGSTGDTAALWAGTASGSSIGMIKVAEVSFNGTSVKKTVSTIIPASFYYKVTVTGSPTVTSWNELR